MLFYGAEFIVRGGSKLASRFGLSPMVIGLTVVAFGTSLPELVVGIISAFKRKVDFALGNILGSNFANVFLALGMAAIIQIVKVPKNISLIDVLTLLIFTIVFSFILLNLSFLES